MDDWLQTQSRKPPPKTRCPFPRRKSTCCGVERAQIPVHFHREVQGGRRVPEFALYGWNPRSSCSASGAHGHEASIILQAGEEHFDTFWLLWLQLSGRVRFPDRRVLTICPRRSPLRGHDRPLPDEAGSAMSFGNVALTEPPDCRSLTSFAMQ